MAQSKQFSQASLQDYSDCKRRYYYRYIVRLDWPAIPAEPVLEIEELLKKGKQFHAIVCQYLSGVSVTKLEQMEFLTGDLKTWWQNFLGLDLLSKGWQLYPEKRLSVQISDFKFVAKYDLIAVQPDDRIAIFDWKTAGRLPERERLSTRLQTIVYPLVLADTGGVFISGQDFNPEKISMTYWFGNHPESQIVFGYTEEQHNRNTAVVLAMAEEVSASDREEDFPLTDNISHCKFCVYRSLCDRGISAGIDLDLLEDSDEEIDLNFDQIQEIEF